ncbi:MAG: cytidylate kinase-like family protein [Deltaproteobacteria bacterium]|nr:cytidylate kinase-like family protein [Deltaproteobacteria bacterium]
MAVITISRQFGAGGRTLGQMIAEELGYDFVDDVIIHEVAKKAKVSTRSVKSIERTAGGKLSKIFSGLISSDYMDRMIGEGKGYIDEEIYVDILHEVIKDMAKRDHIVLMGRGGQYILQDDPNAFHILLVSDIESRIQFMQRYYDLSTSKAEKAVMHGEKRRANLYAKFGRQDYNRPQLYHLVLNMSKISMEKALKVVCNLVTA